MLALIEAERRLDKRRRFSEEICTKCVLYMNCLVLRLFIPRKGTRRGLLKCLRRCRAILCSLRVNEVCFKEGFPYEEYFLGCGFARPNTKWLFRAAAGEILDCASVKETQAFLSAGRVDGDVLRAYRMLCEKFRYVTVDVPERELDCLFALSEGMGVSPVVLGRDRRVCADAAVFFESPDKPTFVAGDCAVLFTDGLCGDGVYGGRQIGRVVFHFPSRLLELLPEGFTVLELASAALCAGKIAPQDIKIDLAAE